MPTGFQLQRHRLGSTAITPAAGAHLPTSCGTRESHGQQLPGVGLVAIAAGTRRRGSDPAVKSGSVFWLRDGYSPEELAAAKQAANPVDLDPAPLLGDYGSTPPPEPLRDDDAVIVTAAGSTPAMPAGTRLPRGRVPKGLRAGVGYVDVTGGLKRENALVALEELREGDVDGGPDRVIHKGQWIARDDRAIAINPAMFAAPDFEVPS